MSCAPSESGLDWRRGPSNQQRESLEYWVTEHLRVSGLYWGSTALALLGKEDALNKDDVVAFLKRCAHSEGAPLKKTRGAEQDAEGGSASQHERARASKTLRE